MLIFNSVKVQHQCVSPEAQSPYHEIHFLCSQKSFTGVWKGTELTRAVHENGLNSLHGVGIKSCSTTSKRFLKPRSNDDEPKLDGELNTSVHVQPWTLYSDAPTCFTRSSYHPHSRVNASVLTSTEDQEHFSR